MLVDGPWDEHHPCSFRNVVSGNGSILSRLSKCEGNGRVVAEDFVADSVEVGHVVDRLARDVGILVNAW